MNLVTACRACNNQKADTPPPSGCIKLRAHDVRRLSALKQYKRGENPRSHSPEKYKRQTETQVRKKHPWRRPFFFNTKENPYVVVQSK